MFLSNITPLALNIIRIRKNTIIQLLKIYVKKLIDTLITYILLTT